MADKISRRQILSLAVHDRMGAVLGKVEATTHAADR